MNGIESSMCCLPSHVEPRYVRVFVTSSKMPILLYFLQLSRSWLRDLIYNAGVVMETVCPDLSLTKCVFIHKWLEYFAIPLLVMSIMPVFSTKSVVFARDPVIVMDALQYVHKYPLSLCL